MFVTVLREGDTITVLHASEDSAECVSRAEDYGEHAQCSWDYDHYSINHAVVYRAHSCNSSVPWEVVVVQVGFDCEWSWRNFEEES